MTTMTTFETDLAAMKASISTGYKKRVVALLLPNEEHERSVHTACAKRSEPCGCRVCYWARGRR